MVLGYGLALSAMAVRIRFQLTYYLSSVIFMLLPRKSGFEPSFASDSGTALKLDASSRIFSNEICLHCLGKEFACKLMNINVMNV